MILLTPLINYDKTNIAVDPGSKQCIFKRGCRYRERVMNSIKTSTSVMFCSTSASLLLPPYIVYKAEHLWNTWTIRGPQGARYNHTRSWWNCFEDWYFSIIVPYCHSLEGVKVLIGDNLSSHFSEVVFTITLSLSAFHQILHTFSSHLMLHSMHHLKDIGERF